MLNLFVGPTVSLNKLFSTSRASHFNVGGLEGSGRPTTILIQPPVALTLYCATI